MKIKYFCSLIIFLSLLSSAAVLIENIPSKISFGVARASNNNIQFPIPELGNCKNANSCKSYCDKPANIEACLSFAEKNNLMDKGEIETARKFTEIGKGPGGCTTKDRCDQYCNDTNNIDECVSFAEKNGLMSPKELEEAKKVKSAIEKGVKPPACGGKKQCDAYCESSDHMEECITFAEAAGFLSPQEIQESKKVLSAIKKGAKPPACQGKEQCDAYCGEDAHFDECIAFAEAAGFIAPEELEMVKKTRGKGPGGCRGKEECDSFCQNEGNLETCAAFAEENGFMSKEDAAMMRKTGGKGPGGCKGKEECDSFCDNPQNQETCFNFGKEHGLISPEDLKRMEQGKEEFKNSFNQAPPEVINCLTSLLGNDAVEKFKNGSAMPSREVGETMRKCFEETFGHPPMDRNNPENMPMPQGQFPNNGQEGLKNNMPPEVAQCLQSSLGNMDETGQISPEIMQNPDNREKIRNCFEQFKPQLPENENSNSSSDSDISRPLMPFQNNDDKRIIQQPLENMPPYQNDGKRMPMPQNSPNGPMNQPTTPNGKAPQYMPPQNMQPRQKMIPNENNGTYPDSNFINPNMQQFPNNRINIMQINPSDTGPQQFNTAPLPPSGTNTQPGNPMDIQPQQPQTDTIQPQEINQPQPPPPGSSNISESLIGMFINFFLKMLK